jgi:rhodanese-related sulfurtransferase
MPRTWSRAAAAKSRPSTAAVVRQVLLLLALSTALAAGRWAFFGERLPLKADAADYELELAAPLIEVARARRSYDEGVHLFIDTRESGQPIEDTVPGAFLIRPDTFDDDMLALLNIIMPEDQLILFGDGSLSPANNVAAKLIQRGYTKVEILKGGLGAWRAAGGPLSPRREAETS